MMRLLLMMVMIVVLVSSFHDTNMAASAFFLYTHNHHHRCRYRSSTSSVSMSISSSSSSSTYSLGLGEYHVELRRPLGMILEERDRDGDNASGSSSVGSQGCGSGVIVKDVIKDSTTSSAWNSGIIAPGDVLQRINDIDVSQSPFEQIMDLLIGRVDDDDNDNKIGDEDKLRLVFSDGLGQLDMPKNVLQQLKTSDDAYFIDAVVRQAVRDIRRDGRLGELQQVEVVVGAGVQDGGRGEKRGLARFFAIFSTDGVTTYSCNCAVTGIKIDDKDDDATNQQQDDRSSRPIQVRLVSLSCAKDEGLGRTFDLIQEGENL
jgi:hypothetical protein